MPIPARILLRSWVRADTPRIDRWLRPAQVIHATNYLTPPSRLPTLVSVYDCSFVRYPELCTPEVRVFDPVIRRAVARGATLHTGSEFVADEIEEIFGRACARPGRLVVIPLGIPPLGDDARDAARTSTRARRRRALRASRSARSNRARTSHTSSARSASSRGVIPTSASSSPGTTARPGPRSTPRSPRLPADRRERVVLAGRCRDAGKRALLERAALLAYPSIYEGFGFPAARGDDGRSAGRRGARRLDPRGRGRCRAARRAHQRARARRRRWTACSPTTRRVPSSSPAAATVCTRSPGTTRPAASRRATGVSRSSVRVKVAMHAGPAAATGPGRHRPLRDRPAPPASRTAGSSRSRSRPARARGASRAACRGSTSAGRAAACATSCGTGCGDPLVRIEADVVHAPSLAIPPVTRPPARRDGARRRASAGCRRPRRSAGSGSTLAGSTLARRHARLVIVPSEFTARELEREGFARERIAVVPFGVDPPAPRDPDEIDRAVARAGVQPPYVLTVGTVEPRKDVATIVARGRAAPAHASRSHAGRRRTARVGRGVAASTGRSCSVIGAQPWSVLDALYRRAEVFCLASLYEGFGLPVVEAMARGVPTVATTGSALEEVVQGAGALVRARRLPTPARNSIERALDDDRAVAPSSARAGVARAAELELAAAPPRVTPAPTLGASDAPAFVDSLRARAARRLGGPRPPCGRRRVHDRDRPRRRRRAPTSTCTC